MLIKKTTKVANIGITKSPCQNIESELQNRSVINSRKQYNKKAKNGIPFSLRPGSIKSEIIATIFRVFIKYMFFSFLVHNLD